MKNLGLRMLIVLIVMSGCCRTPSEKDRKSPEISKGEECSVEVSGVEFTKLINGASVSISFENGALILQSKAQSDNFNDPDGKLSNNTAPVLLTEVDNTQAFTFIAKVTPTFLDTYDAGTMYIYLNPNWWVKFAFERDERRKSRIVTVRTIETSDDNNHDVVDSESVYMKISSDATTVGFYYSLDNENWQLVRLFRNDFPEEIWVGLSSQSPIGNGISVMYENVSLTQRSVKDFRMGK